MPTLNSAVVVASYLIIGGSIGLIVLASSLPGASADGNYPYSFFPVAILILLGVAGLIVAPYFALAGFIARENSPWFEANRMIHRHIFFPIFGGFILFLSSFGPAFFLALAVYLLIVFLGTLISVMANKTNKPLEQSQEPAKN